MTKPERKPKPDSRLTRIADTMIDTLREHAKYGPDVRSMILLMDTEGGGIAFSGYDSDEDQREAIIDLLMHAQALAQSFGSDVRIYPGPIGRG